MPFPAILTAGAIVTVIQGFVAWISAKLLNRVVVVGLAVTAITLTLSTLKDLLDGFVSSVVVAGPAGPVAAGLGMLPANTTGCLSVLVSTRAAVWAATGIIAVIKMKAK